MTKTRTGTIRDVAFVILVALLLVAGGGFVYWKVRPMPTAQRAREQHLIAQRWVEAEAYHQALRTYDEVLELEPDLAEALHQRGEVRRQLSDFRGAIDDFTAAMAKGHDEVATLRLRARTYRALNEFDAALADYTRAESLAPEPELLFGESGSLMLWMGRYDTALTHLSSHVARIPDNIEAWRDLGWTYWGLGRYDEALAPFDRVIAETPHDVNGHYGRGLTNVHRREFAAALDDLQQATASPSTAADYASFMLFLTRSRTGQDARAREALRERRRKRIDPMYGDGWEGALAQFLLDDISEAALKNQFEVPGKDPDPERVVEGYYFIGMKRLLGDDHAGAVECFRKCVDTNVHHFYEFHAALAELRALGEIDGGTLPTERITPLESDGPN